MVNRIEKLTREAISLNKYRAGSREVIRSVKGSKLIIISDSMVSGLRDMLERDANALNIPVYHFRGTSLQLARLCRAPYRISAISLKTGSVEDINNIMQETEKPRSNLS
jgi:large subunit ribosomal protein L30e